MLLVGGIISCEKETEEAPKPYAGKWQTGVYESFSLTGDPIAEQMTFTFTNTTFEDKIHQGADATSLKFTSAIKGSISNDTDSTMDVEIKELSIIEGIYISKENSPESFQTTWDETLGKILNEEFSAKYVINGDKMQMIIPVKIVNQVVNDTLNLTKID
jgi:hypothetical protein